MNKNTDTQKIPIKVLLIDDDEDSYCLIRDLLREVRRRQYTLSWEYSYEAASERMKLNDQDVCLLDYRLGEHTGLDLLRVAQEQGFTAPIIILTGSGDQNVDVETMKAGAADYLLKENTDVALLERSIRYSISHARTLSALQKSEQRYKNLLEAVTNYIYMVKIENGRATHTSHSLGCEAVTGYTPENFMERPDLLSGIVHPDDKHLVVAQTKLTLAGETVSPFEYRLHNKKGEVHWVRNTIVLHHNEDGILIGYDGLIADVTERRNMEDHLRYISQHDTMTGLHNRAFFSEEMLKIEKEGTRPVSIIMADMDGLKALNDTHGHHAGDDALKRMAALLKKVFRLEDAVARIGGDEFSVLICGADEVQARKKIDQIKNELNADNKTGNPPLSLSLGAVTVHKGESLADGLKQADRLMYRDKADRRSANKDIRV